MKPVKLEILTALNGSGIDALSEQFGDTKKDLMAITAVQEQYIANLRQQLSALRKEFGNSTDAAAMKPLMATIVELESELKDAEIALALLKKAMEDSDGSSQTLRTQIRELEMEMAKMTEGTDEYRNAMERLGVMRDKMSDISQQGRVLADDEKNIRATADAIAGLSGAMSAGVGIASLFGAEQDKLQQIQTRLQAVMATTIGLQQVAQTLNKDSYFSIVILQGAKKKWAATQTFLNTQLGISVGLSKALMAGGIGLIIAGVAALIVLLERWKKKQEEINRVKKEFPEVETETAKAMADEKTKLQTLIAVAQNHNNTLEVRKKALLEIKKIMPEFNGYIDKEGVLIGNADTALKNYLATLYKVEKAKKLFAKIEEKQGEIDAAEQTDPKTAGFWQKLWARFASSADESGYLTYEAIVDDINENYKKKKSENISKLKEEKSAFEKELNEISGDKTVFSTLFGDGQKSGNSASSLPENKLAEQRIAAYRKIKEAEIALMQEGEEKRKAQAELEYKNKLDEISREKAEREKHIRDLVKAKIPVSKEEVSEVNNQAQAQALLAKQQYDAKLRAIDEETARNYAEIQSEIRQNFASRLDAQLSDIDEYYATMQKKAGSNMALVAQIELAHIKARKQAVHEAQFREIEIDNEIAVRRQELDDAQVLLAADRQEKILQTELDGARKRLAKLEEMQRDGMDTAEDIKMTRAEIEKLSASLKKIPVDRVREIGGHLKNWLTSLSGAGGELGESFSALAGSVDDITTSFNKDASTMDKVSSGINGLVKLYQMAAAQLEENRKKQQEWNDKMEESAHRARMMRIEEKAYKESNVFGVDNPYAKAISGAQQYRAAMTELNASLNKLSGGQVQIGTKKVVSGKNIATGVGAGAAVGATIGSIIPGLGTAIGIAIGAAIGGIFGATQRKVVPVLNSLASQYGNILKNGTETFELNPRILQDYDKLDAATKKIVDNWEEIRKKAIDSQEQMRQTFRDLAGDIGNSLSSALVDSFRNGDLFSAVDKFQEKITGTIENIIEQLVFSAHFRKMFDDLSSRMEKSFGDSGDGDIIDDIVWFSKNYKDKIAAYGENMQAVRDELKKQGFDVFLPSGGERNTAARGIAQASQSSVDENNGRLTYIQGVITNLEQGQTKLIDFVFRIFAPLNRIAENTDRLEKIENESRKTRETLEKIERDGLNLKK